MPGSPWSVPGGWAPERAIRVLWPQRYGDAAALEAAAGQYADSCALYLLDAGRTGGGSGRTLVWEDLEDLRLPHPWLLAGGMSPANLRQALARCRPDGVDCNSGVEDAPGRKKCPGHDGHGPACRTLLTGAGGPLWGGGRGDCSRPGWRAGRIHGIKNDKRYSSDTVEYDHEKKGILANLGGCFVPELLMPPLLEVEAAMRDIMPTQQFQDELQDRCTTMRDGPRP